MTRTRLMGDCETGEQREVEMTDADEAACAAVQADLQARQAAAVIAAAARDADIALLATHPGLPDEVQAALGRLLA